MGVLFHQNPTSSKTEKKIVLDEIGLLFAQISTVPMQFHPFENKGMSYV